MTTTSLVWKYMNKSNTILEENTTRHLNIERGTNTTSEEKTTWHSTIQRGNNGDGETTQSVNRKQHNI